MPIEDFSNIDDGPVTIDVLVRALGVDTLAPVGPVRDHLSVSGVEFHDPAHSSSIAPGMLLLVPLWHTLSAAQRDEVVDQAQALGAAGLVVRHPPEFAPPWTAGPCMLSLNPHISWRQLEGLIERLLGEESASLPLPGSASEVLFAVADNVASVYGGAVSVEDHARNLLAYSTVPDQLIDNHRLEAILARRVPDVPLNREQYRQVLSTDGVTRFPTIGEYLPRAAVAIRGGGITLGTVWAIDPGGDAVDEPLAEDKRVALEQAAGTAGAHLLSLWHSDVTVRRPEDEALRRILVGAAVGNEASSLRLFHAEQLRLVGFASDDVRSTTTIQQLRTFIDRRFRARNHDARTTILDDTVYALLTGGSADHRADDAVADVVAAIGSARHSSIRSGLSQSVQTLAELRGARAEVDALLRVADATRRPMAVWPAAQPDLLVDALDRLFAETPFLRHPVVDALASSTSTAECDLRDTILEWLQHRGNIAATAAGMSLHENTVRYRVRRFQETNRLSLDDPDLALALWAQLRSSQYRRRRARAGVSISHVDPGDQPN